jgi:hypothetical protein
MLTMNEKQTTTAPNVESIDSSQLFPRLGSTPTAGWNASHFLATPSLAEAWPGLLSLPDLINPEDVGFATTRRPRSLVDIITEVLRIVEEDREDDDSANRSCC